MVGSCAMAPQKVELNGGFRSEAKREEARREVMDRFERIGIQIMNRSGGGPLHHDPISGVLSDRDKRAMAAQIIGQAYVSAFHVINHNKDAVEKVAETVIERRELYGNELLEVLEQGKFEKPEVDLTKDEAWPRM
jgi:hypothetical protein